MRKSIKGASVVSLLLAISSSAIAADETLQASVQVLEPISITLPTFMGFGKILPSNNGQPNTFSSQGGTVQGSGNGMYVSGSGAQTGLMRFEGSSGESFEFVLSFPGCTSPDLSLSISRAGPETQLFGPTGSYNRLVTGLLTVQSDTPAGSYTCDYTVTANYQ